VRFGDGTGCHRRLPKANTKPCATGIVLHVGKCELLAGLVHLLRELEAALRLLALRSCIRPAIFHRPSDKIFKLSAAGEGDTR